MGRSAKKRKEKHEVYATTLVVIFLFWTASAKAEGSWIRFCTSIMLFESCKVNPHCLECLWSECKFVNLKLFLSYDMFINLDSSRLWKPGTNHHKTRLSVISRMEHVWKEKKIVKVSQGSHWEVIHWIYSVKKYLSELPFICQISKSYGGNS